jgi:hypothetical protein
LGAADRRGRRPLTTIRRELARASLEPGPLRAGLGNVDLYTATRNHFAWCAWNVLGLDPADIAQRFGHQDGGELVRKLYGQFD